MFDAIIDYFRQRSDEIFKTAVQTSVWIDRSVALAGAEMNVRYMNELQSQLIPLFVTGLRPDLGSYTFDWFIMFILAG